MEIERYLERRNESQSAFAKRAGVSQQTISAIVLSRREGEDSPARAISIDRAYKIVRATIDQPTDDGEWVSWEDLVPIEERPESLEPLIEALRSRRRAAVRPRGRAPRQRPPAAASR